MGGEGVHVPEAISHIVDGLLANSIVVVCTIRIQKGLHISQICVILDNSAHLHDAMPLVVQMPWQTCRSTRLAS